MFNSLNNIRLILENPMKSREMITRLSEMLRYSLTKVKSIPLHLRKKLKWSKTLSPFQNSTGRSIAIYFRNRRETLRIQIPPMIIQMLIENAIKHGISLKHGGILLLN
jgi:LytS/YehU family sensor histidine kinase